MKSTRELFEEIWTVPKGVLWSIGYGEYMPVDRYSMKASELSVEWDGRLDTFTRCQETTALYVGIIDEMAESMCLIHSKSSDLYAAGIAIESIGRAKQKLEQIK